MLVTSALILLVPCLSATSSYLSSIPRSQICSSDKRASGSLQDDLSRLEGDGDACIYRIQNEHSDSNLRIKLKVHEFVDVHDCAGSDRVYVFADGRPYGPYCPKSDHLSRHRRYTTYDPSRYTNFDSETGNPDGLLEKESYNNDRILTFQNATEQVSLSDADEIAELVHNLTFKLQNEGTEEVDTDGEVEGTFKAQEVDVVYVTAPGGYKFRFKFNFEWELIQIPGNGTVGVINGTMPYGMAGPGSYPQYGYPNYGYYVPQYDQYGIPYEYAAQCDITQFTEPSNAIFHRDIESTADPEYAMKFYQMMTKSLAAFKNAYGETYAEHCDNSTLEVPCEMFRYPQETTIQEVVGTLRTITFNIIDGCIEGFGWQWVSTIRGLSAAVGGIIPDIIIPNVSEVHGHNDTHFTLPIEKPIETVTDNNGNIVGITIATTEQTTPLTKEPKVPEEATPVNGQSTRPVPI